MYKKVLILRRIDNETQYAAIALRVVDKSRAER